MSGGVDGPNRATECKCMVDLSRRTMANIHQNIVIALGLKVVFLITTIACIAGVPVRGGLRRLI